MPTIPVSKSTKRRRYLEEIEVVRLDSDNESNKNIFDSGDSVLKLLANWTVENNVTLSALSAFYSSRDTVRNDCQHKVQASQRPVCNLINRHHGRRRYDSVDSPTNAPKARRDRKTGRAERVPAAGDHGLPLTKSSSSSFWPILGYTADYSKKPSVFLIGLYWGKEKPSSSNLFFNDLVEELKYLATNGIDTAFGKKTCYYSCPRCTVDGVRVNNTISCLGTNFPKRTHLDFINRTDDEHHKAYGLNEVEKLLEHFVEKFEELYGEQFVSQNIHGLIHIVDDYRKFGSLEKCSCFSFENYMKFLKKKCEPKLNDESLNGKVVYKNCIVMDHYLRFNDNEDELTKKFNKTFCYFEKPINSLKLGIAIVDELSENFTAIDIEFTNFSKYMLLFTLYLYNYLQDYRSSTSSWVNKDGTHCAWPKNINQASKLIDRKSIPNECDFDYFKSRILKSNIASVLQARNMAGKATNQTDLSDDDYENKSKPKKSNSFYSDCPDYSELDDISDDVYKQKLKLTCSVNIWQKQVQLLH
ncbi:Uncharacterized protein FWK35_00026487 [Aphis craccivora]|uniref:Uncharacterized protein n=1 Tax=Aphis craccivora TaxID=307492 RepID=A0A6G0XFE6_APHCR|nr:Uncharacterized protein FWK35_00026487 [Aphis craccivora]